ncbi:acyl-CoA thioesterase [Myxococcota bacterium]|nr:acyl-CoA thioesterase [Myxococcota bacterium]
MPIVRHGEQVFFETSFWVTFADTNVVGNVYFANYILWQGKCREIFFAEVCPGMRRDVEEGLLLVTLDLGCRYIEQLHALDRVVMRMNVESLSESRMMMNFKYYRVDADGEKLVCESHQSVAAMRAVGGRTVPVPFPELMLGPILDYGLVAEPRTAGGRL